MILKLAERLVSDMRSLKWSKQTFLRCDLSKTIFRFPMIERQLTPDVLENVIAQPSILDVDAAGSAYGPSRLSLEDAKWVNSKIAEDLSRGRINHAPHFMTMVRQTLEEPHVLMAREAVERAKQHDRARLGLGIGPAAWMDRKYDDEGFHQEREEGTGRYSSAAGKGSW